MATNRLEGLDIFHLKGEINSSIWSTKTFLYEIRKPRYKNIKMGYHISKFLNIGQSSVLKSDVPYYFTHILAPLYFKEMGQIGTDKPCLLYPRECISHTLTGQV